MTSEVFIMLGMVIYVQKWLLYQLPRVAILLQSCNQFGVTLLATAVGVVLLFALFSELDHFLKC